jgi:hypothetical protein
MIHLSITGLDQLILQIASPELSQVKVLILVASGVLAAAFGLLIGYQAFRGYRRNRSKPMLYIASGIVLLTTVPFIGSVLLASIGGQNPFIILLLQRLLEFAGLACITYALYGDHDQTQPHDEQPQERHPNANR